MQQGIKLGRTPHGIAVMELHYSADAEKGEGEKIFVPEINLALSPWAYAEYVKMTDKTLFLQEYEIDAEATQGQFLYHLSEAATVVEEDFLIPPNWTRYFALDPHPGIPHAALWCAVDPWGDVWFYREFWPSKICYQYQGELLTGKGGLCIPDDYRIDIKEFSDCVKYSESDENPQNTTTAGKRFEEVIRERVIDYTARAFGKGTNDDPEQENFQQRYEKYLSLPPKASRPFFSDAKKDHDAGYARVREGLAPRVVMNAEGSFTDKSGKPNNQSRFRIIRKRCPELIYQIKNNRIQQLTATQAQAQDPTGKPIKVRNHMTDLMRYLAMANPIYVEQTTRRDTNIQYAEGLSY